MLSEPKVSVPYRCCMCGAGYEDLDPFDDVCPCCGGIIEAVPKRGRPALAEDAKSRRLPLTLSPEMYAWVKARGGTKFVMKLLKTQRELADHPQELP